MAQDPSADGGNEITCLIVDDHEVVREGLRLSLSRAPHIRVIGEASDGASAVSLAERRKPQVVIMDVRMPGMDGLEATKHLTAKVPETSVLIFTAYSERSLLSRGLESGAKGYILKEAPHQTLVKAIEKIAAGDGYVDPALMPAFLPGDRDDMLTAREREILQLLADGMSNVTWPRGSSSARKPSRATSAHPHQARSRHANARGGDCASRGDHRLRGRGAADRRVAAAALLALAGLRRGLDVAGGRRDLRGRDRPRGGARAAPPAQRARAARGRRSRARSPFGSADHRRAGGAAAPRALPP